MIRIICDNCKNAYLQETENGFDCPSCKTHFEKNEENRLLGIECYNKGEYAEASDYLMKALTENGADAKAVFYKGLCDGKSFDEDTVSLAETYRKLAFAFEYIDDEHFPELLELADTEMTVIEKDFTELHLFSFEDADAEKIKKEVAFILKIRDEALSFRKALTELADRFNERNEIRLKLNLSKCNYVSYEAAGEVGDRKLGKIKEDIASHTVFTGILSADIKNLEIYYRCVVMFFPKSKAKYDFLLENAKKFASLNGALETGKYMGVTSPPAASERLKTAAYDFFEESLKEYDDEEDDSPSVTKILPEPPKEEAPELPEEKTEEIPESDENGETMAEQSVSVETPENTQTPSVEETEAESEQEAEENPEDVSEESTEETAEEPETATEESAPTETASAKDENNIAEENTEENTEENGNAEVISEKTENNVISEEKCEKETEITDISSNSLNDIKQETKQEETKEETAETVSPEDVIVDITDYSSENSNTVMAEEIKKTGETLDVSDEETTLKPKKKNRTPLIILIILILSVGTGLGVKYLPGFVNQIKYNNASSLLAEGNAQKAETVFASLGDYKDSKEKVNECEYTYAEKLCEKGDYEKAADIFKGLDDYKDASAKAMSSEYEAAKAYLEKGDFDNAENLFKQIKKYGDSADMIKECSYKKALKLIENKSFKEAVEILTDIEKYSDAKEQIKEAKYGYITENFKKTDTTTVSYLKELAKLNFRNTAELKKKLLGESKTAETSKAKVTLAVNASQSDNKTSQKSVSSSVRAFFHITAGGKSVYNKPITLTYTTQYGYSESTTVTLSETNKTDYMSYYASGVSNYTVTFSASLEDGTTLGSVTVTMN